MNLFKSCIAVLLLTSTAPLMAGVVLDIGTDGQLKGAKNVEVQGVLYDVTFVDGSFIDVFGDASNLDATYRLQSSLFSQALNTQVIEGTSFDTNPQNVVGCSNQYQCDIVTPYNVYGDINALQFEAYFSRNHVSFNGYYSYFGGSDPLLTEDFTLSDSQVFADWQVASVPAPASALLLMTGLLTLRLRSRV